MEILTITLKVEGWDKSNLALLPGGRHWLCLQRALEFSVSEPGVESPALSCRVPSHHAPCAVASLRTYHFPKEDLARDLFLLFHRALPTGTERLGPLPHPTIFTKHPSLDWPQDTSVKQLLWRLYLTSEIKAPYRPLGPPDSQKVRANIEVKCFQPDSRK